MNYEALSSFTPYNINLRLRGTDRSAKKLARKKNLASSSILELNVYTKKLEKGVDHSNRHGKNSALLKLKPNSTFPFKG